MELRVAADIEPGLRLCDGVRPAVTRALQQGAEDATTLTLREVQVYPAQRPPARGRAPYRRTRTLARSWFKRVTVSGNEVVGEVISNGNIAPYNVYVQMATMQARVHRGTWLNTDVGVIERLRPQILRLYEARLQTALGVLPK